MCGVLLIRSKNKKLNKSKCLEALNFLKSRGPDKNYFNFFENNKLFIGNTLLGITGKSKKNDSLYNSENHFISFNGEIYNYKEIKEKNVNLNNSNDTDFLIQLINKIGIHKTLKKIDGMFAFIAFDKLKKTLNIATDTQGEKRLFFFENDDYLIISTTIQPILYFIKKINLNFDVLNSYFNTRHLLLYKNTVYKNIKLLKPGTLIKINLRNEVKREKLYFDPINFISKKKYLYFKKMTKENLNNYFEKLFKRQIKQMIPERKFGCIVTGGIDSSLVVSYINDVAKPHYCAVIDHDKKDAVVKQINLFEKIIKKKIYIIKINSKKYFLNLAKVYKYLHLPFLTHDYPSRYIISKFFYKKKCKVMFTGDGADELFGGYDRYIKTNWKIDQNSSPYSKHELGSNYKKTENLKHQDELWQKAYNKYLKFMTKKEASIQASLFTDYYIQGVSVSNIGTDLVSGMNSIEPRCLFIRKQVIQSAINLPLKYKINFKEKNKLFKTKPLLKNLFSKRYDQNMIMEKQGFSGFPNESKNYLSNLLKKRFKTFLKFFNNFNLQNSSWKVLNLFYFNLYCKKISLKNLRLK